MNLRNLKKITMGAALGFVAILGTSEVANAQYSNDKFRNKQIRKQEKRIEKQERKIDRQQQKIQAMRYRVYQQNGGYYNTDERGVQISFLLFREIFVEPFKAFIDDFIGDAL